jgi:hypothetical protein
LLHGSIWFGLHAQKTRLGQDLPYPKPGVNYPISVRVAFLS